jgi:hypothetical protein
LKSPPVCAATDRNVSEAGSTVPSGAGGGSDGANT